MPHHDDHRNTKLVRKRPARADDTPLMRADDTLGRCHLLLPHTQVSGSGFLSKKPPFSYPSARPLRSTIYLIYPLNVNHVLDAVTNHRTASILWNSHRFLSLIRNDVCHVRVQETYRGQCNDKS